MTELLTAGKSTKIYLFDKEIQLPRVKAFSWENPTSLLYEETRALFT